MTIETKKEIQRKVKVKFIEDDNDKGINCNFSIAFIELVREMNRVNESQVKSVIE